MSTIERLKELEAKAMHAASRDYQYSGYEQLAELRDLVPLLCDEIHKLLAVVEAAKEIDGYYYDDKIPKTDLKAALKALDENSEVSSEHN